MAANVETQPSQAQKFSRYRSVRKAANAKLDETVPPLPPAHHVSPPKSDAIARSMSRYRRHRTSTGPGAPPPLPTQQSRRTPAIDNPFKTPPRSRRAYDSDSSPAVSNRRSGGRDEGRARPAAEPKGQEEEEQMKEAGQQETRSWAEIEDARDQTKTEESRRDEGSRSRPQERERRNRWVEGLERIQPTARQTIEERAEMRSRSKPALSNGFAQVPPPGDQSKVTSPVKERPGFWAKTRSKTGLPSTSRKGDSEKTSYNDEKPQFIEPNGGGVAAGVDAPISAVNAGERRVTIRCQHTSINLPVTPETTPVDLIRSAANILSQPVDISASVLLESYLKIGLERPIRKYEHIRDIMNSWDRDSANALLLVPSAKDGDDRELDVKSVPEDQPEPVTVQINYSQRPGKWKKQCLTLREDGQIQISKKEGAAEKDTANVCHLSDFDIYTPTASQLKKVIRPGKKHCFAVKSQQKSSLFTDQTTFVHFFATNDKRLASQWYSAVQQWRSWYLVHRMGEGQKKTEHPKSPTYKGLSRAASKRIQHKQTPSTEEPVPYQIGSFQPLLTTEEFSNTIADPPLPSSPRQHTSPQRASHARKPSTARRQHSPPPSSFHAKLSKIASPPTHSTHSPPSSDADEHNNPNKEAPFAPTSLLGRTYSHRRAALDAQKTQADPATNPFTPGSTLLATSHTQQSPATTTTINRSPSQKPKPKPLLDFSHPTYQEPPQHQRKGRGYHPAPDLAAAGTALVDAATSPETAIKLPSSTTWRRPSTAKPARYKPHTTAAGPIVAETAGGARPSTSINGHTPFSDSSTPRLPLDGGEEGFTGLLARQSREGQGALMQGRGVRGEKGRPLVDLRVEESLGAETETETETEIKIEIEIEIGRIPKRRPKPRSRSKRARESRKQGSTQSTTRENKPINKKR